MIKAISLILRISLVCVASLLFAIAPAKAQTLTPVNLTSRVELVSNQTNMSVIQPQLHHRPNSQPSDFGCNCSDCTQARLLLVGKLPLASLI